jgi:hypothetical protein
MGRLTICLALSIALAGCDTWHGVPQPLQPITSPSTSYILLDGISVINTQKTIEDHLVSLFTGMDCSTIRASKGDHYCLEMPEAVPVYVRTSYCYKSIAKVSCYTEPLASDVTQFYGIRIDRIPVAANIPEGLILPR